MRLWIDVGNFDRSLVVNDGGGVLMKVGVRHRQIVFDPRHVGFIF